MQIPEFWAELRLEGNVEGKKRVVRRFGWSEQSQKVAQIHAQERAVTALAELQQGKLVPSHERKLPYGGLGLPIREEIVARNGDDIITRNGYGARCINEPDVLFADIDIERPHGPVPAFGCMHTGIVFSFVAIVITGMAAPPAVAISVAAVALIALAMLYRRGIKAFHLQRNAFEAQHPGKTEEEVRANIREFINNLPGSRFALYKTPAGLRLLALHRTYDPVSEEVQTMFRALGTDPAYAQMCALQACFRARVSPKPWRMGMPRSPNRRVWPIPEKMLRKCKAWISEYETRSMVYASCQWLGELGSGKVHDRCKQVQRIHDEMSQAHANLPIA